MRVGVITNFTNLNYGSVLQATALQFVIRDLGCDPVHINWERFPRTHSHFKEFAKPIYEYAIGRHTNSFRRLLYDFVRFRNRYINQSPMVAYGKLSEISKKYDAFICGSDQIWAPNQFDPVFFLDFVVTSTKKIAYAPSVGLPEIPFGLRARYQSLISSIPYRSIREEAGAILLKNLTGIDIPVVLDPTLLLNKERWTTIAKSQSAEGREKKGYILCYFLGNNPNHHKAAVDLSERLGRRLVKVILRPNELNYSPSAESHFLSPAQFLSYYASSDGVITDSFHGTAFSILFQKPFWTFDRFRSDDELCQNSRVHNILHKFSLESRLYPYDTNSIESSCESVDYLSVQPILDSLRDQSIAFLRESLASAM